MKISISILAFLLFIGINFSAAQDYYRGSVVTIDNKTLVGYIEGFEEDQIVKSINFRSDLDGTTSVYQPTDLKEFSIRNKYFISADVKSLKSKRNFLDIVSKDQVLYINEKAFLQVLVDGKKKLYYYRNQYRNENFYIHYNDEIYLLEYNYFTEEKEGKDYKVENKKFRGQLNYYFQDCEDISPKVEKTEYTKPQLITLFESYYKCISGETYISTDQKNDNPIHNKSNGRVKFALMPGFLTSYSSHDDYSLVHFSDAGEQVSYGMSMAVRFEFFPSKTKRNFSISAEINNSNSKFSGNYVQNMEENKNIIYDWDLEFNRIKLNILPMYRFHIKKFDIVLSGGFSTGFNSNSSNVKETVSIITDGVENNYEFRNNITDGGITEFSILAGVAVQYWKVFIEVRYDSMNKVDSNGFSANFYGIHTFLGYRF